MITFRPFSKPRPKTCGLRKLARSIATPQSLQWDMSEQLLRCTTHVLTFRFLYDICCLPKNATGRFTKPCTTCHKSFTSQIYRATIPVGHSGIAHGRWVKDRWQKTCHRSFPYVLHICIEWEWLSACGTKSWFYLKFLFVGEPQDTVRNGKKFPQHLRIEWWYAFTRHVRVRCNT